MYDFFVDFTEYACSFLCTCVLVFPFLHEEWRRDDYVLRFTVGITVYVAVIACMSMLSFTDLSTSYKFLTHLVASLAVYLFVNACYRLRFTSLLFVCFYGITLLQNARLIIMLAEYGIEYAFAAGEINDFIMPCFLQRPCCSTLPCVPRRCMSSTSRTASSPRA